MNIQNLMKIALKALNNNKMRCFLTMLGVIIGVGAVIAMLAIGQGSKDSIKAQISEMGSNMIMIFPGAENHGVRNFRKVRSRVAISPKRIATTTWSVAILHSVTSFPVTLHLVQLRSVAMQASA